MRGRLSLTLGALVLLSVACGTDVVAGPAGPGGSVTAGPGNPREPGDTGDIGDPVDLVGLWTVRGAAGEEPGVILRLGDRMSLWRECGHLDGSWRAAAGGLFVGHVFGSSQACSGSAASEPVWLRRASGYRTDGQDRLLVGPDGRVLARLVPGGRPTVDADTAPSEGEPPVLTDDLRRALSVTAAPLPEGLRPAAGADLVGRWVRSAGAGDGQPFVRFAADGGWNGSDGCNGQGGRWVIGSAGSFLAVAGPQTLIGCAGAGADIGIWLTAASRAGVDGDELVLLDPTGRELGRLHSG